MAQIAGTDLHPGSDSGDDKHNRLRFRFWQLEMTTVTIFVTTWFCKMGPAAAIVALLLAKHMLVSILVVRPQGETLSPE